MSTSAVWRLLSLRSTYTIHIYQWTVHFTRTIIIIIQINVHFIHRLGIGHQESHNFICVIHHVAFEALKSGLTAPSAWTMKSYILYIYAFVQRVSLTTKQLPYVELSMH